MVRQLRRKISERLLAGILDDFGHPEAVLVRTGRHLLEIRARPTPVALPQSRSKASLLGAVCRPWRR